METVLEHLSAITMVAYVTGWAIGLLTRTLHQLFEQL